MLNQATTEALKVQKIIKSCETKDQLKMCGGIVDRYNDVYYPHTVRLFGPVWEKHNTLVKSLNAQIKFHQAN